MSTEDLPSRRAIDDAVLRGAQQIGRPVFFAILIVIAAFIPLLALQGIEGRLFVPLALYHHLLDGRLGADGVRACARAVRGLLQPDHPRRPTMLVRWLRRALRAELLDRSIRRPWYITAIWLGVTAMSIWLFSVTGSEFLPSLDENNFRIRATLPTSISLQDATDISMQLERIILQNPNVEHVIAYIGRARWAAIPEAVSNCELSVPLKPPVGVGRAPAAKPSWNRSCDRASTQFPGVEFEFSQELEMRNDELISGFNTPIAIFVRRGRYAAPGRSGPVASPDSEAGPGPADVAVEQSRGSTISTSSRTGRPSRAMGSTSRM